MMSSWAITGVSGVPIRDPAHEFEDTVERARTGAFNMLPVTLPITSNGATLAECSYCGALMLTTGTQLERHLRSHRLVLWALDGLKKSLGTLIDDSTPSLGDIATALSYVTTSLEAVAKSGLATAERVKALEAIEANRPQFRKVPKPGTTSKAYPGKINKTGKNNG